MPPRNALLMSELAPDVQRQVRSRVALGPDSPLLQLTRKPKGDPEHLEQRALFEWADDDRTRRLHPELELMYAVPNWFGTRTAKQGARAKAEGRRKGFPDVCLPVARSGYHSLYVEMKAADGSLRPEQRQWLVALAAEGHCTRWARGADEAKAMIIAYLSGAPVAGRQP